ncbi:MAG TPA: amino acid transporter, partial [Arthrobacter sp.]
IISIVALLIGMVIVESTRESLLLSLALAAVVVVVGVLRYRRNGAAASQPAVAAEPTAAPAE